MLTRPGVREWWGSLDDAEHTREGLVNGGAAWAIEVDGVLAGWLGCNEETEPNHRYASLDIFWRRSTKINGWDRLRAIRAYEAVGFRPVGTMRCYERGADGREACEYMQRVHISPHLCDRKITDVTRRTWRRLRGRC